ncbi:AzlC family ABC transporter permease [Marinospirillum insulare]|uniref:Branched-chain amino acid ABC transporter permease n=1 Tax=Marinospirillum insulare TaxID=217169 RepID=A0ABQ5ZVG5_9GAMM|nr:AzlC family ABC transporter permease [Marinospirillum insulare]GLR64009.1 branched-chain amino acid ABC transporter permease [Marinospirillum insulare]
MSEKNGLIALKVSLPVFFGYLPLGASFGVLFSTQLDYAWWIAPLMAVTIFAGSGQLLAVSLLVSFTGLTQVFIAMLLLNARHVFYGLSLLEAFKDAGWRKFYLIFGLTDETYSLLTSRARSEDKGREQQIDFLITLFNHAYWILGCGIGAWLGKNLTFDATGIEFALIALFIVLCIEQYKVLQSSFPIWVGAAAGLLSLLFFPESQQLLIAMLLICAVLFWQYPANKHRYKRRLIKESADEQ